MNTTSNSSVHRKVRAEKKNKNNYFSFQVVSKVENKKAVWINQKIISGEAEEPTCECWRDY
jgi:hypothetical protein